MKLPKELTTVTPLSKYLAMALFIALPIAGFFLGIQYQKTMNPTNKDEDSSMVACTQDAKICPDGTYVGRQGPNCEFAACPDETPDETANWKTYKNEEFGFEFRYPQQHYVIDEGGDYWDVYMYVPGEPKTPDKPIDPPSLIMDDHEGEISLESYISRLDNARNTSTQVLEEKRVSVGGYPALQRVQRNLRTRPPSLDIETFIDISPTMIWRVLIFGGQENDLRNFNGQILSTFRFSP